MPDSTITDNASVSAEIAEIEKAVTSETETAEQTEEQKPSAFEALAAKKNFKSVDDLVSAYTSLESKMAPQANELKELRKIVEEIRDSNKPAAKDILDDLPEEQRQAILLIEKVLDRRLNEKLSPLLEKVEVDKASQKIEGVRKAFPGSSDAEIEQAISIMEKYPKMPLEDAMKIASYERAKTAAATSTKKTVDDQKKKRAFSESASSARVGDDVDYSKMTLEELEEIIGVKNR